MDAPNPSSQVTYANRTPLRIGSVGLKACDLSRLTDYYSHLATRPPRFLMSALPLTADMDAAEPDVRFGSKAGVRRTLRECLLLTHSGPRPRTTVWSAKGQKQDMRGLRHLAPVTV